MDLSTQYCGLTLSSPFMPGASPLARDLDAVRRFEDAGAAAIVMHSLFEEQIIREEFVTLAATELPNESFAEALTYMPFPDEFRVGPEEYLERISQIKEIVNVPVIASLNGTTPGGWIEYARLIEQAGADALELNPYRVLLNPRSTSADADHVLLDMVERVIGCVKLPLAVKLSPYHAAPVNLAAKLRDTGAQALVLFNRHFQPDIDIDQLEMRSVWLSHPSELQLRLRWLGILDARVPDIHYAATGGVHSAEDAIKALMSGADAVQIVSHLLAHGPAAMTHICSQVAAWLEAHEYNSLDDLRGSMNLDRCPDPGAYQRAHYIRQLQGDPFDIAQAT